MAPLEDQAVSEQQKGVLDQLPENTPEVVTSQYGVEVNAPETVSEPAEETFGHIAPDQLHRGAKQLDGRQEDVDGTNEYNQPQKPVDARCLNQVSHAS